MNSPRDGSSVKPLTPVPVLNTNCRIIMFPSEKNDITNFKCRMQTKNHHVQLEWLVIVSPKGKLEGKS